MPRPYPKGLRDDVVRVVLNRDAKTTIDQIAKDFGAYKGTVANWLSRAQHVTTDRRLLPAGGHQ